MPDEKITERGAAGCLVLVLASVFMIVASIAVGVIFGAGFGFAAYACFLAFACLLAYRAFRKLDGADDGR